MKLSPTKSHKKAFLLILRVLWSSYFLKEKVLGKKVFNFWSQYDWMKVGTPKKGHERRWRFAETFIKRLGSHRKMLLESWKRCPELPLFYEVFNFFFLPLRAESRRFLLMYQIFFWKTDAQKNSFLLAWKKKWEVLLFFFYVRKTQHEKVLQTATKLQKQEILTQSL